MKVVQQQLKDLGYFEVGIVDRRYGFRTRAAVLAFRIDNGLGLSPDVDPVLTEALQLANASFIELHSYVTPERVEVVQGAALPFHTLTESASAPALLRQSRVRLVGSQPQANLAASAIFSAAGKFGAAAFAAIW